MTLTWCSSTMLSADDNDRAIFVESNYLCGAPKSLRKAHPYQQLQFIAMCDGTGRSSIWHTEKGGNRFGEVWEAAKEAKP